LCAEVATLVTADAVSEPVRFDPSPVDFGGVPIDADRSVRVVATNLTDEPLAVRSFGLEPWADAGFELDAATLPPVLLPLFGETFQARFSPTKPGAAAARARLDLDVDPAPHASVSLPMHASAGGAQLVVAPERLAFKGTPVGGRVVQQLVVGNGAADPGAAPLRILSVEVMGDGFASAGPATPFELGPGARQSFEVRFSPASAGPREGLVRVVAACRTPVVSAIGHEKDSPLLDLVADWRASTPTDAGKRIVPDMAEELRGVALARDAIDSGRARTALDRLVAVTRSPAA
jgi:hypothetical protein